MPQKKSPDSRLPAENQLQTARNQRLAAQLRDNLKKRKTQQKLRAASAPATDAPGSKPQE